MKDVKITFRNFNAGENVKLVVLEDIGNDARVKQICLDLCGSMDGRRVFEAYRGIKKLNVKKYEEDELNRAFIKLIDALEKENALEEVKVEEGKMGLKKHEAFICEENGGLRVVSAFLFPVYMYGGREYAWDKTPEEFYKNAMKCFYASSPEVQLFVRKRAFLEANPSKVVLEPSEFYRKGRINQFLRMTDKINPWHGGWKEWGYDYYKIRGEKIGEEEFEMRNELFMEDNLNESNLRRTIKEGLPELNKMEDKERAAEILKLAMESWEETSNYTTKESAKEKPILENWTTVEQGYNVTYIGKQKDYAGRLGAAAKNYEIFKKTVKNEQKKEEKNPKETAKTIARAIAYSEAVELFFELNGLSEKVFNIFLGITNEDSNKNSEAYNAYWASKKVRRLIGKGIAIETALNSSTYNVFASVKSMLENGEVRIEDIEKEYVEVKLEGIMKKVAKVFKQAIKEYLENKGNEDMARQIEIWGRIEREEGMDLALDLKELGKIRKRQEKRSYRIEMWEEKEFKTEVEA